MITHFENLVGESPKYDESYHRKQFKSKSPSDIVKAIVEIVKNGVDAYIEEKGAENCINEKIDIVINRKDRTINIINYAEGMDIKTFEKALRIGGDTGSKKEQKTGAHGYGMKEAAWAFDSCRILTVKNERYSSRIFFWDKNGSPKYAWEKDLNGKEEKDFDKTADLKITKKYLANPNGTYFEGLISSDIKFLTFDALLKELSWHVLLRSINQSNKFDITLTDVSSKMSRQIKYVPPEIQGTSLCKGEFSFEYPNYGKIKCEYELYHSNQELGSIGDSKEAGLLICAGDFSVLDCTLFENAGKIANHFFGKAILRGPLREISKKERILDDRRISGLVRNTPLYLELSQKFNPILRKLIEDETKKLSENIKEVDQGVIENKKELLKELNKIAESEDTSEISGDEKFNPGETGIRFCISGNYEKIIENQNKNIYLVIDTKKVSIDSAVEIASDKTKLNIEPNKFRITKREINNEGIFKKKINFYPEDINTFLVTATVSHSDIKTNMYLEVINDIRLHINTPLGFIPSEQDIVTGSSKKISLIMNKSKIPKLDEIDITSDQIINAPRKININKAVKLKGDIYELAFSISCAGKPNQKAKLTARLGDIEAMLSLEVISPREKHIKGPFNDIKNDYQKDPSELGYFDNKTINIYVNHPIFKYYLRHFGNPEENPCYRVLYAEAVVVEALKELTREKVKIFSNTNTEEYRVRFDERFNLLYKKYCVLLHNFCIDSQNFRLTEEN